MQAGDEKALSCTESAPKPFAADPAVLGLTGLAVAALVLAAGDLGLASVSAKSLMIPWTLMLGATAQLIAGIIDFRRNNMFGATAFTTYSLLWYAVSITLFITIYTGAEFDIIDLAILALILNVMAGSSSKLVGIFLMLVASASFTGAGGILINTMSGRALVPLGAPLWRPQRAAQSGQVL